MPERTKVLFTAHSLPERVLVDDPYPDQLWTSAAAVARRLGLNRWAGWGTAWQSAGRTADPWRGPDILDVIDDLAETGRADGLRGVRPRFRVRPPRAALRPRHRGQATSRVAWAWPSPGPMRSTTTSPCSPLSPAGWPRRPRPSPHVHEVCDRRGRHHRPGRGVRAGDLRPDGRRGRAGGIAPHRRQDSHDPVRRPAGRRRRRRVPGPASRRRGLGPRRRAGWAAGVTRCAERHGRGRR